MRSNGVSLGSLPAAPPEAPLASVPARGLHVESGHFGDPPEVGCSVPKY